MPVEHTASMPSRYVVLAKFMMLSSRAAIVDKVLLRLDDRWLVTAWNIPNGKKTCRYRVKHYRLDRKSKMLVELTCTCKGESECRSHLT
jgi:hypothetical protein